MSPRAQDDGIAIVGLGAILPGALGAPDFWRNLLSGREIIRDVPPTYWLPEDFYDPDWRAPDKVYCKRGAFIDPVDFDPMKYGVPPKLLENTDTCQLLALMVADQVLHDSLGDRFAHVNRDRIGCILGICSGLELVGEMAGRLQRPSYVKVLREHGLPEDEVQAIASSITGLHAVWNESTFPGLLGNVVTGRISNHFDLGGPNFTTDAACASSFAAVAMAANMLRKGDADLVITGGADTANDPFTFMCFSKTPALSMSSVCAPFSEKADGTMLGEGITMLALRRLADAERDSDRIYAVLRACGSSSDGRAKSIYAPRWEGQVKALRRCYEEAGYGPETVEMIEAHGTGTKAGDQAEFDALRTVYNESGREDRQWCAVGSIKSQLGHTKANAGAVGLMKTVLALHHKVLPPTFNVDRPAAKLEIEKTPFYLNTEARPWIRAADHPRRASTSSFGFGGTNFHLTIEEYTGDRAQSRRVRALPTELVLLSGPNRASVVKSARELAAAPAKHGSLPHIARESQDRFRADAPARLAIVVADEDDLRARLVHVADSIEKSTTETFSAPGGTHFSERALEGGVGFVFSGQGSQYVSMGADVAMSFDAARAVWDEEATNKVAYVGLHEVVFPKPVFTEADREECARRLRATEWAQPAIGAVSASYLGLLQAIGLKPQCMAGHSFGELSALFAAGALDRTSFLRVARQRGELMAHAAAAGAGASGMTAVTASLEQVEKFLSGSDVVVGNHNDPRQVVVSGPISSLEEVERRFEGSGLKVQRLPVAAAFHSSVVAGSVDPFARFLDGVDFERPSVPVIANATAKPYPEGPAEVRSLLSSSIARRVRFVDVIEAMYARGVRTFVEVGPGSVLSSMIGRICGDRPHRSIPLDRSGKHGVTSLWQSLAQLAAAGHAVDFSPLWAEFDLGPDPRSEPKPKMTVSICGTNYGKRYPPEGGAAALPPPNPVRVQVDKRLNGEVMDTKEHKSPSASESTGGSASNGAAASMPRAPAAHAAAPHENGATAHANGAAKHSTHDGLAEVGGAGLMASREYAPASTPTWSGGQNDASAWLNAYESIQCRTAEAHAVYQQTMAQCHLAFLRTAEQSALALASIAVGAPALPMTPRAAALPPSPAEAFAVAPMVGAPAIQRRPAPAPSHAPSMPRPAPRAPSVPAPAPAAEARTVVPTRASVPAPAAVPARANGAAPAMPADGDLKSYLFSIVSEKTGYPVDILNLDQQLEADLGIDSIKRVEILSAFEGQIPDIKDVNLEEVTKLATLRDVLGFMDRYADKLGLPKKKE